MGNRTVRGALSLATALLVMVAAAPSLADDCGIWPGPMPEGYSALCSTFDADGEGWTLATSGALEWLNHGWYGGVLRITDAVSGDTVLVAPPQFHGDLSAFNGGMIWFGLWPELGNPGCPNPDACGTVTITGPAGSVSRDLVPATPSDLGPAAAALTADAWGVSPTAWAAILANVTDLRVNIECSGNGEVLFFDGFTLVNAPAGLFPPDPNCCIYDDAAGDIFVRPTSSAVPASAIPPDARVDVLQYRIGNFTPTDAATDLIAGSFDGVYGPYLRFDLLLNGLVVPPGPQEEGNYHPFLYGSNPLFGTIEFDVDDNIYTGGELERAQDYFLGNAGRFGFKAFGASEFANRTAHEFGETQAPFSSNPQVKYTGMDFELMFNGQPITNIEKRVGDQDNSFEAGETWVISGHFFCRAKGYEFLPFWSGTGSDGVYCPEVQIMFSHDNSSNVNKTTVSLVFSLINFVEIDDYSDDNESSVLEGLSGLVNSNHYTGHPEDDIIQAWDSQSPIDCLQTTNWTMRVMVATAYNTTAVPADGQKFVWTDFASVGQEQPGDVNGDGVINGTDQAQVLDYIAAHDGDAIFDSGPSADGVLLTPDFGRNFNLHDVLCDGRVDAFDDPLSPYHRGDLNCDAAVDGLDIPHLVQALLDPAGYAAAHAGPPGTGCTGSLADMNNDTVVDARDVQDFVALLLDP